MTHVTVGLCSFPHPDVRAYAGRGLCVCVFYIPHVNQLKLRLYPVRGSNDHCL